MLKKLGILVVLLFGVGMVVYGAFTINENKEVDSEVLKEIDVMLGDIEIKVSEYLSLYVDMLEDLSLNDEILYYEQENYAGFTQMEVLQKKYPDLLYIYYGSETGKMLLRPETDLPEDYDPRARPWYEGALNNEELVWTQPYVDAFEGHIILSGALQVVRNEGLNGVLGFDLKLDQHLFVPTEDLAIDYEIMAISEWGMIIHHSDGDVIGLSNLDGELARGIEEGSPTFEYVPFRTLLDIEQSNFEPERVMPSESKDERTAFVKKNKLGWTIIISVKTDDLK